MVYVLVALGLTLIFSILEIINFAHGEFYMLGGYVTYYVYALFGLNYFATLVLAIVTVGLAGVVAERLIFHDLRGKALNAFIVSLGLLWVMQAGAQLGFGVLDKPVPSAFSGVVRLFGLVMSVERIVVSLTAIVLIVGLYLFLRGVEGLGTLFMGSAAVNILGFLMVIVVLLVRPRGLVGGA